MLVNERMTKRPVTVMEDYSISHAYQIMTEGKYSQLPVVDGENKFIGLLTEKMLAEYTPSKATTLSVYEVGYILSKSLVKDVMKTDAITVDKNAFIEDAAVLMRENRINSLPVVENGFLIGILTKTDIFTAFIDLVGAKAPGARITITTEDKTGALADIAGVFASKNISIRNFTNVNEGGNTEVTLKLRSTNVDEAVEELKAKGYNIKNITIQE